MALSQGSQLMSKHKPIKSWHGKARGFGHGMKKAKLHYLGKK